MTRESELFFKTIENTIRQTLKRISYDREAMIVDVSGNICTVVIDGQKYKVKNGIGINFKTGDKCLIHYINGSEQNKVIIAKM